MTSILTMGRDEILGLSQDYITWQLSASEVIHMAKTLNAFWSYDYEAAKQGRTGYHAELKSGLHSDGFFVSKILLEPENIRRIIAEQMVVWRIRQNITVLPDYVAGIPDGATSLGKEIARILGRTEALMEKRDGKIILVTDIGDDGSILLIEDFCTRGTGFAEAVTHIRATQRRARILPWDPVIINRGGLTSISVTGVKTFYILPLVEKRIQDWQPIDCPLCLMGSKPIKPKATDENWKLITESQR